MASEISQTERAGANLSLWEATSDAGRLDPLRQDVDADVCIVGAGISGLSVAYTLALAKREVVVIDDGLIGRGMTARTTAHLVNALDDRYFDLEKLHGHEGARLAAESHTAAIDRVEKIVSDEKIDCGFERVEGYLFDPPNESSSQLEEEFEACRRAGISVKWADSAPIDNFHTGRAIQFPRQAQFHPLKYLQGLTNAIRREGGRIFTGSKVTEAEGGDAAHVKTADGFTVRAQSIVVATNSPINDRYVIHTKQAPYTTYVIGLRVPKGSATHALFWDTAERAGMLDQGGPIPYHYVRVARSADDESEILVVGGEDHKTAQGDNFDPRFERLEQWARDRWPDSREVAFRWSGQVMEPVDGLAFIGRNPADRNNVYIVTGDSGNGMTHGTLAGLIIPELIRRGDHPWAKLYDPSRVRVRAAVDFAKENINVAEQFFDYFTGSEASLDQLGQGEGATIRRGIHKVAAYRDESGTLREFSAVCPHLKCIVHWNRTEKTWDCPCHGSRFDALGHVLNGPAIADLKPIKED